MISKKSEHRRTAAERQNASILEGGRLIVNADDWGRDRQTTDRTRECIDCRSVSSVSAMVFMEDSERAAGMAREKGIDAGLHLNLTAPFSGKNLSTELVRHHTKVISYLRKHRLARTIFHPGLARSFEYVVAAQIEEYSRLYGTGPGRLDGHHHMHLCANVLYGKLMPAGTQVRRNFSFQSGEKGYWNRMYRRMQDRALAKRHRLTDYFFTIEPCDDADRLRTIFSLAAQFVVEVETHPVVAAEYRCLTEGKIFQCTLNVQVATCFAGRSGASNLLR
jgi:predicted glycoside hydrolase/deacetylase ChbG (UPF0249 family)